MSDPKPIIPSWGYHATEEPRIFELIAGEKLPDGWHNSPDRATWKAVEPPKAPKPPKAAADK